MPVRRGTLEDMERLGIPRRRYVISSPGRHQATSPGHEAALFHRCRKARGLSTGEVARARLIAGDRDIRR